MNTQHISQAWATGAIGPQPEPLAYGSVELWPDEYQAFVAGRRISLTRREFELLHVLVARGGHVVTKQRIHDAVWGPEHRSVARDRSVDVYVRKLRGKFRDVAPSGASSTPTSATGSPQTDGSARARAQALAGVRSRSDTRSRAPSAREK